MSISNTFISCVYFYVLKVNFPYQTLKSTFNLSYKKAIAEQVFNCSCDSPFFALKFICFRTLNYYFRLLYSYFKSILL